MLYGDPRLTEQLINTTPYKQKYKSGVLSFTEDAKGLTDEQKKDIMQRFEDTLFTGLEPDQYDILWIEHSDKDGRLELNFLIPGQELRSGKRLQPFYAKADLVRVNAFKNIINQEYGLTDPNEPERKRLTNPYINNAPRPTPYNKKPKPTKEEDDEIIANPPNTNALKEAIDRKMLQSLANDELKNRKSVINFLGCLGLEIKRATKSSISVLHPTMKRNIRLKGAFYKEDFRAVNHQPRIIEELQQRYARTIESRGSRDSKTWIKGMEIKKEYHQEIYGDIKAPEPLDFGAKATLPDNKREVTTTKIVNTAPQRFYSPRP
ncbi:hypothetical protein ACS8FA_13630 [Psychrobacter sp. 1Y1]|uniref:hypothetical protein n=1 Tax=Psychrobacter sp. 1Y1 TaxID=3453574 RepID=UPI003F45C5FB